MIVCFCVVLIGGPKQKSWSITKKKSEKCKAHLFFRRLFRTLVANSAHPRRPRGCQSGREKRQDECSQVRAKEPLGTNSHQTISKNSSECWLVIGHKKCFVLLCLMGELAEFFSGVRTRRLLSRSRLAWSCTKRNARSQEIFSLISNPHLISKYCLRASPKTKEAFPEIQAGAYNRYSRLHRSRLA